MANETPPSEVYVGEERKKVGLNAISAVLFSIVTAATAACVLQLGSRGIAVAVGDLGRALFVRTCIVVTPPSTTGPPSTTSAASQ